MFARDASKKDISEMRERLKERQKQRALDRDAKEVMEIVNRHSKKEIGGPEKPGSPFLFSQTK